MKSVVMGLKRKQGFQEVRLQELFVLRAWSAVGSEGNNVFFGLTPRSVLSPWFTFH